MYHLGSFDEVPCHDGGVISIPVYTHTHTLTQGRWFCAAVKGFQIAVGTSDLLYVCILSGAGSIQEAAGQQFGISQQIRVPRGGLG